jgi:hypothetical protein
LTSIGEAWCRHSRHERVDLATEPDIVALVRAVDLEELASEQF